jgi:hypothetical protein
MRGRGTRLPLGLPKVLKGAPENRWDWLLYVVREDAARARLLVDSEPAQQSATMRLQASFDFVLA